MSDIEILGWNHYLKYCVHVSKIDETDVNHSILIELPCDFLAPGGIESDQNFEHLGFSAQISLRLKLVSKTLCSCLTNNSSLISRLQKPPPKNIVGFLLHWEEPASSFTILLSWMFRQLVNCTKLQRCCLRSVIDLDNLIPITIRRRVERNVSRHLTIFVPIFQLCIW
jgi:hypothetical protein